MADRAKIHLDGSPVWEVERDRHGVMFSGPLEVGECREVIPVPCGLCGGYGAMNEATGTPVECIACGKKSEGLVLIYHEPGSGRTVALDTLKQRGGLRLIEGGDGG